MAGNAYSFLDIQAAISGPGGNINLAYGAAVAEEGISYEMSEDKGTMVIGADGTPMMSLNAAQGGVFTIRLLKTSPTNGLLSAMYDFQRSSSAFWGQNVVVIRDPTRGDMITGTFVAFARQPNNTFAKAGNVMEWRFPSGILVPLLGAGVPQLG